jgi:S-adenosylmethionine:tRNA ribosyltransferase-isomerase
VTLHVGAGTFQPVVSSDARDHAMHSESFSVSVREVKNIVAASKAGKPLVVVGTTSARTLESLFWMGVKRIRGLDNGDSSNLVLGQFEWAPLGVGEGKIVSREAALEALIADMDEDAYVSGQTSLMITPGHYDFKCADHLVTNFHAPDSTLMLLVSAFVGSGSTIKEIYEDAQEKGFRFLSYGDVCLFSRPGGQR